MKPIRLVVITMGISPIVNPILESKHTVAGLIECAPRTCGDKRENRFEWTARRLCSLLGRSPRDLAAVAERKSIPYYYMDQGSSGLLEDWVRSRDPDLIVIYQMSHLLGRNIFSIPRCGAVNLHPSLLPKYRGPNPWFWMYHDMDLRPGATVHYLDEGEDTGDIVCQEACDIAPGASLQNVYGKILEIGVNLLIRTIDEIAAGRIHRSPQPRLSPTIRARNVHRDEGLRLIHWEEWPVQRVWHFLRGAARWIDILPAAGSRYGGPRWQAGEYEACPMNGRRPGMFFSEAGRVFLACKDGKILLEPRGLNSRIFP